MIIRGGYNVFPVEIETELLQNPEISEVCIIGYQDGILGEKERSCWDGDYAKIMPGKWCLPCGYIEGKENFVNAAKREVKEETGLETEPQSIVNVVSNHFSGNVHSLVVVLMAKPVGGELIGGDDLEDAGWFDLEGPHPDLAFQADLHIIKQYIRYRDAYGISLDTTVIEFNELGE